MTNAEFKNANEWTPNGVVSAGHNYIVWNCLVQTGENDGATVVAPGDKWVFYNAAPGSTAVHFCSKEKKMTFNALKMLDNTGFLTYQAAKNWTMEWAGNYDIQTTSAGSVHFTNNGMAGTIVSANLSGRGRMMARSISADDFDYYMVVSGNNTGYVGTFTVTNTSATATTRPFFFKTASETNFGGNPERFAADALRVCGNVAFTPTAPMTIDDPNRGVTLENGVIINTPSGCDLTLATPLVVKGDLIKRGTGVLAYGAGGFTPPSEGWALTVEGGALKVQHAHALKGATATFASGTELAINAVPPTGWGEGGLDLATTTLAPEGGKLAVRFDATGVVLGTRLTVATFASAEAAQNALNLLTLKRTKGYRVTLTAEGATLNATIERTGCAVIVK